MAKNGTHCGDVMRGVEGTSQQADRVQILEPFAVEDIGLAAGHLLEVASVDQADLDPSFFQDGEERDPVDAGGLHGHGRDTAVQEPTGQGMEVLGEGGEGTYRVRVPVGRHGHEDLCGPYVDASGVGIDHGSGPLPSTSSGVLLPLRHSVRSS